MSRGTDPAARPVGPQRVRGVEVLAFLCELAMLVLLVIAGCRLGSSTLTRTVLAIVLPLVAAVIWAVLLAPTSPRRLPTPSRIAVQVAIFTATGALVAASGLVLAGTVFAAVAIVAFCLSAIPANAGQQGSVK